MSPENLSRRAILAGAASVPALALPSVASTALPVEPDPIFAAIEVHLVAAKRFNQANRALDRAQGRFLKTFGNWKPDALDDRQNATYAETVTALEPEAEEASEAVADADWDLFHTAPTTAAGVAAVLRYVREGDKLIDYDVLEGREESRKQFCGSLELAACALAGLPAPDLPEYEDEAVQS